MLKDPRADNICFIRDLVVVINQGIVRQLSDLRSIFPNWTTTRQYHYWSAVRDLGFANIMAHNIVLTPLGKDLAQVAEFGEFSLGHKLNTSEKMIFKKAFSNYKPAKRFFSYFIQTGEPFKDFEQLMKSGGLVVVIDNGQAEDTRPRNKKSVLLATASGNKVLLKPTEVRAIMWSLKLWCKDVGVIDEISLKEDTWYSHYLKNLPPRFLFPIKCNIDNLDLNEFIKMLENVIEEKIGYNHIFIPLLTYHFCTTYFVSVRDFHSKLSELYHSDPYHYYLELGSLVGVDESVARIRNYGNYPKVDGNIRSYLLLRK